MEALKKVVEFQIEQGVSGIVPIGTTGESPTLTQHERETVIKTCIEAAGGRIPVIVGTGSNSTATTVAATEHAKKLGANAALVVNPYYNKPSQEGLFQHVSFLLFILGISIFLFVSMHGKLITICAV